MPTYEYYCEKCKNTFETIQKINDKPLAKCPKGHTGVKRLISNTSFVLKGSGWYVTDYARKEKGKDLSEKKEAKSSSSPSKKEETKSSPSSSSDSSTDSRSKPSKPANSSTNAS
jgi:putative FmdB family regulatory protein